MRNNLAELPVLLCCLWGGSLAGGAAFLLRLPKKLYFRNRLGLRTPLLPKLIFILLDILTCASVAVIFAASLLYANGGELRLYAAAGFFGALAVVVWLLKTLLF